ncbi:MAG TPA: RuBisCO large subunit C-terminal-like domain-containing protein [Usitatibacter sp.]|nr:RuBisCO large subunit C-terminal-like domain-containing protein [Usitatibacter sp.]
MERILATYRIAAPESESRARAEALATEQSVEMPLAAITDERILRDVVASVESIRPHADYFDVVIGIAPSTTGNEVSQLANMLFGNCSLQPEVELVEVRFPAGYASAFPGPRFGIEGLRDLTGARGRALTCAILKPQGSPVEHFAQLAGTYAMAGVDVIKDDHGVANQAEHPFDRRVPAVQRAVDEANRATGGSTVYAPTFSGGPRALATQARIARDAGVRMALVAPMLVGLPVFLEMQEDLGVPVMAHPAFAGAQRIAPPVLLGTLFRLLGADAIVFPNHGGRFGYSRATCLAIADSARGALEGARPALPVPAGGMSLDRVDEMLSDYGIDTMLLIGGGLLAAREALSQRTREFVERVRRAGHPQDRGAVESGG